MLVLAPPQVQDPPIVLDDGWGPAIKGGHRKIWTWRRVLALVVLTVLLLPVWFAWATVQRADDAIVRIDVTGLAPAGDGPTNILVVGSDSREDLSREDRIALTTGTLEGERTDTMFVLSFQDGKAGILAFPRDLWVRRCDGSTGRLNAATNIGGAGCLVETVSQTSGIKIQHFLKIDFLGFRDLVDAVGGVEVCPDKAIKDKDAGIDLPAGCQTLDGIDSLGYVRVRKIDNDLQRIQRQQEFVRALADKAASKATLQSPSALWALAGAAGAAVQADSELGTMDLISLALAMRGIANGDLVTATVPTDPASINGADVLLLNSVAADPVFADFRDGEAIAALDLRMVPGKVTTDVVNGAGVPGLADRTAQALQAAGFKVSDVGNGNPGLTTIRHPAVLREEAEYLASALPIRVQLVLDDESTGIVLRLGADFPTDPAISVP